MPESMHAEPNSRLLRPIQSAVVVFALALTLALVALTLLTWLDFKRIESIRSHVNRTELLQQTASLLEDMRAQAARSGTAPREQIAQVRTTLAQLPIRGAPVGQITFFRLAQLDGLLQQMQDHAHSSLDDAVPIITRMLDRETAIQSDLLETVYAHTRLERQMSVVALFAFPAVLTAALWTWRQRIFTPINTLRQFLARLSNGDFAPVSTEGIAPMLRPLFDNYNVMVTRLQQLEHSSRTRTLLLEKEVRTATEALLKQQQSLARAERLAATGELSAILAHELRNPIAGIQLSLANLRRDIADTALTQRIDLVSTELQRITRLLNGLLRQSSHLPEPARLLAVDALLHELATLLRYQLPSHIKLDIQVPSGLTRRLPEDGLRQAVLNLVLNSMQALQDHTGTIRIEASNDHDNLIVKVSDDGPGFAPEMLSTMRPVVPAHEPNTGLGLAIVRRFAKNLGGELRLDNQAPHGACATLSIPCFSERKVLAGRP